MLHAITSLKSVESWLLELIILNIIISANEGGFCVCFGLFLSFVFQSLLNLRNFNEIFGWCRHWNKKM